MSTRQKRLLGLILGSILTVILLTWGSVGSAILTLALLLAVIFLGLKWSLNRRDAEDFCWEE